MEANGYRKKINRIWFASCIVFLPSGGAGHYGYNKELGLKRKSKLGEAYGVWMGCTEKSRERNDSP